MTHHRSRCLLTIAILAALPLAGACGGDDTSASAPADTIGAVDTIATVDTVASTAASTDAAAGSGDGPGGGSGDVVAYCAKLSEMAARGDDQQVTPEIMAEFRELATLAPEATLADALDTMVTKLDAVMALPPDSPEMIAGIMQMGLSPEMIAASETFEKTGEELCGLEL